MMKFLKTYIDESFYCRDCFYNSRLPAYYISGRLEMTVFDDCLTCVGTGIVPIPYTEVVK